MKMSPFFKGFLKENGTVIVSGIITERLDEVKAALEENDVRIERITEEEGWNAILCRV